MKRLWILLLILTGCGNLTPRAQPIDPPGYALELASQDFVQAEYLPENWWTLFCDDQLDNLIQTAFTHNPTLQIAQANIELAAADAATVRSTLFPSLTWGGDISRQKFSETGIIPFGQNSQSTPGGSGLPATGGQAGIPVYFTQYETELILNYDFDLWGKNRSTLAAAAGEVQAAIADCVFSHLALGISVAQVYYKLQTNYQRVLLAEAAVKNKEAYLRLTERQIKGNINTALSLQLAEFNLALARRELLQIQGNIAVDEYRLKTLLAGDFTECIQPVTLSNDKLPLIPVPCDLPLTLISRRPDITSQLWLIDSAGHLINAAKASFYPNVNLTAFAGFQTLHLKKLFEGRSGFYNIDPAFTLPIFDGGRLVANLWASEINYDLAIYEYNHMVLNAAGEVLEALAVLRNTHQQLEQYTQSAAYQAELYKLTTLRVQHHIDSDLTQLDSEIVYINAQDQKTIALGNTLQASLSLIRALGGGYEICN